MYKSIMIAAMLATVALVPAYGQDKASWCTEAHMSQMDTKVAAMSDAAKKKEAQTHLQLSKDAMQTADTTGCIAHMEEAHKSMGL